MSDWDLTTRDAPRARRNRAYHQLCPVTYGRHRAPTNEALDRSRANGSAPRPKHCNCLACSYGFTHISQTWTGITIIADCRVPGDFAIAPEHLVGAPHACTPGRPCEARVREWAQ